MTRLIQEDIVQYGGKRYKRTNERWKVERGIHWYFWNYDADEFERVMLNDNVPTAEKLESVYQSRCID